MMLIQYSINRLTNRTHILLSTFEELLECWCAAGAFRLLGSDVVCFPSAVPKESVCKRVCDGVCVHYCIWGWDMLASFSSPRPPPSNRFFPFLNATV